MVHAQFPSRIIAVFLASQILEVASRALPDTRTVHDRGVPPPYMLPQPGLTNLTLRSTAIAVKQAGWLYGPPVAGGPYFPTGALGLARVALDQAALQVDDAPENTAAVADAADGTASAADYNGLRTLDDYTLLYQGHWKTTLPKGPLSGLLSNYTQDLLFSMERLSFSPYQVRRLNPALDTLQFSVDDIVSVNITGFTIQELFQAGRLFYADYRDQKNLTQNTRYSAACDAYFYIDQSTADFLPLAIRTNVGSNLIYTANDSPDDWLLAKIMYNVNDVWFAQWNHLASTHEVVQIAYLAAIRTLSDDHPVLALLDRLMYEVYAIQPLAQVILFTPGAVVDQTFPHSGPDAQTYSNHLYQNLGSGRFQANYFTTDLESRGLMNSKFGPPLKDFPFHEDAGVIHDALSQFMTTFINSYYTGDSDVLADAEIQAWVAEAQGPAKAIDFPSLNTREALVNALTHLAHLVSTSHHTVNTNSLLTASATLPFHPLALYQPPPTAKNATDLARFLPPLVQCELQFTVDAIFARPFFVGTNRTLIHMFDNSTMLGRMNDETRQAADTFANSMRAFSRVVSGRRFDGNGLSQGMPFIWTALDPNVAPYSITT